MNNANQRLNIVYFPRGSESLLFGHEHKLYNITDSAICGYISISYSFLLFLGMETVVSQ